MSHPLDDAGVSGEFSNSEDEGSSRGKALVEQAAVERQKVQDMAAREARNVKIWRCNVFVIMFVAAALLTTVSYLFLKGEQEEDFEASVS